MASNVSNYSVSEMQGSDEIREMFCEECDKHLSKYVPAEGFCVDCCVYMCNTCIMYHRRYEQQHNLQDKQAMPQHFCFEKCSVHATELIKFYCDKCDKIACLECRKNEHPNCKTIKHLPTIVEGVDQSKELKDLFKDMHSLSADLENTKKELRSNIQYISMQESSEKLKISNHKAKLKATFSTEQKEEVDKYDKKMEDIIAKLKKERQELVEQLAKKKRNFEEKLDNEETDETKKMEKSKKTDQTNLDSLMKETESLIDEIKTSSSSIVVKQNLGQKCETFIAMKTAQENTNSIAKKVSKLKVNNEIRYYRTKITQTDLTKETLENTSSFFSFEDIPKCEKERIATFHSDIRTQYSGLKSSCLLSQNKLIISYYSKQSIVTFNDIMQRRPSVNDIDLSSEPYGIAKVKENKVAVTFPHEGIAKLITFSETMTVTNTEDINVGARCVGIACSNDNLIVSFFRPGKVKILNMSGHELKTFDTDSNGQHLFDCPRFLALSPDNTTIYVSDYIKNTVTSMTFDGKVNATYKQPNQLTVDDSGAVYVCGRESNNVHQLSSDLRKVKILLDETDGLTRPQSAAYCQKSNRLYVGLYDRNIIKVFNITLK